MRCRNAIVAVLADASEPSLERISSALAKFPISRENAAACRRIASPKLDIYAGTSFRTIFTRARGLLTACGPSQTALFWYVARAQNCFRTKSDTRTALVLFLL